QTFVAIAETYFFGRLGTEALAGFALVFPFMMLMTMMAAVGMGGGVAAATARALGAGRRDDARALVLHALVLGLALALLFTLLAWTVGPALYRLLGGKGAALANAETYSHVLFSGSIAIWANFFFSALLRGGGDAATPGRYMLILSVLQVPLSGVLALGIGDWPGLGMAGPAASSITTAACSALLQARALWKGKLGFTTAPPGLTTLVGVAAGANDWKRAVRASWIGGLTAFGMIGLFGWIVALVPEGWSRLFTSDPQVIAATVGYITHVAPFYCLFGLGMTLSLPGRG